MRLCANENVPGDCVAALRQRGHDVFWIRETARGSSDDAVLAKAQSEARLLITFDKDFGDLVFQPIHRWVTRPTRNESRQGRQNPVLFSSVFFRPSGACGILRRVNPAINRWVIFGCPCGTKTTGGVEP